jgi:uroporphyrinogen-III synthase
MKIAITRLSGKGDDDPALCRRFGYECFTVSPLVAHLYPDQIEEFAVRVNRGDFDCVFFTSALPVMYIAPLLERWPRIVAIGPQTARLLERFGIGSEILPEHYSRAFAPYLGSWLHDRHVGIPRADVPNSALSDSIRSFGGIPHEMPVYALAPTCADLPVGDADALLFTSVMSFQKAVFTRRSDLLYIAIGEITADAMRNGGIEPAVVGDGSLEGTLQALAVYLDSIENVTMPEVSGEEQ